MQMLHSLMLFNEDAKVAKQALAAYSQHNLRYGDGAEDVRVAILGASDALDGWKPNGKLLFSDDEITAILNGIALLDVTDEVDVWGPDGGLHRHLQDNLLREMGRKR